MKKSLLCIALGMVLVVALPAQASPIVPGTIHISPGKIVTATQSIAIDEGILFVPENRAVAASRVIGVSFWRIPGPKGATAPPVVFLPGGPGEWFAPSDYKDDADFRTRVDVARASGRDVLIINQRGHPRQPAAPELRVATCLANPPPEVPDTLVASSTRLSRCFRSSAADWQKMGVDVAGYDIRNIAADVDAIRAALGYDRIIPFAISFGSQWTLAVAYLYPAIVDRAVLGGVEPLDLGYDSPLWVWQALERLARHADTAAETASSRPRGGYLAAMGRLIRRLDATPASVEIVDREGRSVRVGISGFDLREILKRPFDNLSLRQNLEKWPRFVAELDKGDLRFLAALTLDSRRDDYARMLMPLLVDNSLGISSARDRRFQAEAERVLIGELNAAYRATRGASPTVVVGDSFRAGSPVAGPVWLIQGDLDLSTPVENARELASKLPTAHLTLVPFGGHFAIDEALAAAPSFRSGVEKFLAADTPEEAATVLRGQARQLRLPPLKLEDPRQGPALYDQWRRGRYEQSPAAIPLE